jgi:hypothetical protein
MKYEETEACNHKHHRQIQMLTHDTLLSEAADYSVPQAPYAYSRTTVAKKDIQQCASSEHPSQLWRGHDCEHSEHGSRS